EPRVETAHLQAQLTRRSEIVEMAEDPHLQAVAQAQSVLAEDRSQAHAGVGEELDVDGGLAVLGVLDETEIGVRPALAPPLDLASNPDTVGEPPTDRRVDRLGQFADRIRRNTAVVEIEVERHLTHGRKS